MREARLDDALAITEFLVALGHGEAEGDEELTEAYGF